MKRLIFGLLLISAGDISRATDLPAVLSNVYLASRLGTDRILIQGGFLRGDIINTGLTRIPGEPDSLYGADLLRVTPEWLAKVSTDRPTNWHSGDRWKLYTGAGAPVDIRIDDIVIANRCVSAVARFADPGMAGRVAGLTASRNTSPRLYPGLRRSQASH